MEIVITALAVIVALAVLVVLATARGQAGAPSRAEPTTIKGSPEELFQPVRRPLPPPAADLFMAVRQPVSRPARKQQITQPVGEFEALTTSLRKSARCFVTGMPIKSCTCQSHRKGRTK